MPLYAYRAINEDAEEVRGTVDAADLDGAKQALTDLHLQAVELNEAMRLRRDSLAPTGNGAFTSYAFEGEDAAHTVQSGTIQARTKRDAFEKLARDRKLTLRFLTPVGLEPTQEDADLRSWALQSSATAPSAQPLFTVVDEAHSSVADAPEVGTQQQSLPTKSTQYFSLFTTIRLYAGWLLAWYGLFTAVGYYSTVRAIPFDIPLVSGFSASPLIFGCMLALFLYLLFHSIYTAIHANVIVGMLIAAVSVGCFFLLQQNASPYS